VKYSGNWQIAKWCPRYNIQDADAHWLFFDNSSYFYNNEMDEIDENRIISPDEVRDERLKEPEGKC